MRIAVSKLSNRVVIGLTVAVLVAANVLPGLAKAAQLNNVMVRFDRMSASTATTGTVCATAEGSGTEADVKVTFPTGYTVSTTLPNWSVTTTNTAWPAGAIAWPGIGGATAASGQDVTFPSGDLTPTTTYCFNWSNNSAITTKATATNSNVGTVTTEATGPVTIDSGNYSTATVTSDQVLVTASVSETFSFALNGTSDNLGTLSTGAITSSPSPRTATVSTNANFGWKLWAKDSSTGLNSASKAYTISSTTPGTISTLTPSSDGYNTGVRFTQAGGSGTVTLDPAFDNTTNTPGKGGGLSTSFRTLASSNGTANNAVMTLTNNATISPITPAASDYQDTLTIVAAGLF